MNQADYMRATLGDDQSLWRECRSLFPCGTPLGVENLSELAKPPRGLDRARAELAASGYRGERVVIINPTDFPLIGPHGQVTADLLRRLGMNVDLAESDWGTVVQRRVRQEPVEQGGWSVFHTYGSSLAYLNPAVSSLVKGPGRTGWFGWYESPRMQELVQSWMDAPDAAASEVARGRHQQAGAGRRGDDPARPVLHPHRLPEVRHRAGEGQHALPLGGSAVLTTRDSAA